jgi:AGZA family xanthine/uracil permease-like MFS transporter
MTSRVEKLNDRVARSYFGRYFQLENSGHRRERVGTTFTTELRAGVTIFFAMACKSLLYLFDRFLIYIL